MSVTSQQITEVLDQLSRRAADGEIASTTLENIRCWLTEPSYDSYQGEIIRHVEAGDFKKLDDVFWTILPFGTGGRRGGMYPIGTNVMNERTVGESAQGLADYLRQQLGDSASLSCVIAHDTRNNSPEFARLSACVLAGNGIKVFLFDGHRSTPQLSFAVIRHQADAGIVISASHNPPSDNGFKCYWSTGGQVLPPHDAGIIDCVAKVRQIETADFPEAITQGRIQLLGEDDDEAYVSSVAAQAGGQHRDAKIVYTPLHGVGGTNVVPVLQKAGFSDLNLVPSQSTPDGNFPNVANHFPNPEEHAALAESISLAAEISADIVMATDPDADRLGGAAPDRKTGEFTALNGNQIGALLAEHVIQSRKKAGTLPANGYVVKTLVTTDLVSQIATQNGLTTSGDWPVGFKWIAKAIDDLGPDGFVFGAEESHGYLAGQYARDKDGAVAAVLLAELTAECKARGSSVLDYLNEIYLRYGYHLERLDSRRLPGRDGAEKMNLLMEAFRTRPPQSIGGLAVDELRDYQALTATRLRSSEVVSFDAIPANQVVLSLERPGWRVVARPSGTEPKIKFYTLTNVAPTEIHSLEQLATVKRTTAATVEGMIKDLDAFIGDVTAA